MRPLYKELIVGALHLLLVASLGGKLLYDRASRPRVWARAAPYDPNLPIRGRYVSLQLEVQAPDIFVPSAEVARVGRAGPREWWHRTAVVLSSESGQLVARRDPNVSDDAYAWGRDAVMFRPRPDGTALAVLADPVLYFIPEHITDPSRRQPGEELWVEVTLPRKGPPRPIRLGVKKDGALTPLEIN